MSQNNRRETLFWLLVALVILSLYLFIGQFLKFAEERSPLVFELFAAIMGSIVTVSAMALMMRIQGRQETRKEFSARLFDRKLAIYQQLMEAIFTADDDNVISREEIQSIENTIGLACLVANADLVSVFSQFLVQVKVYGVLYFRSLTPTQLEHFAGWVEAEQAAPEAESKLAVDKFALPQAVRGNERDFFVSLDDVVQGMREDLAVVEGNVQQDIEHFVRTPYDAQSMIKDPNVVD